MKQLLSKMRAALCVALFGSLSLFAENPGEFRPKPIASPQEKVGATGLTTQPPEMMPHSRAAAPAPQPTRKPKLAQKPLPTLRADNELVLNAGWEMAEAPQIAGGGGLLSRPGVDTTAWYDATVPGTVLTTLIDQGVYPDPYWGLNNLSIPESLNQQDYWYRNEFLAPDLFTNREIWLEFGGINYYAEIWFNNAYLGHITGAFIRGQFNVTGLLKPGQTNVLAVMIAPPPNPGQPGEQSVKFGPGPNGGTLCLDGPTFVCTEGWDWIPGIRDRCSGIWQDVVVRATGPVAMGDAQVVTDLPLPDTSRAELTVSVELRNASAFPQEGLLEGVFESGTFEKSVALAAGEVKTVVLTSKECPQLLVNHPRLWWPNGYGAPELYHLQMRFTPRDGRTSDWKSLRFGIREMSYELALRTPQNATNRFEYFPTKARGGDEVIDLSRPALQWRLNGAKEAPTMAALRAGAEQSPALRAAPDEAMGSYLVVKVNGQRIACYGGNWGMDDALKRIPRERLEPYVRLHRDANLTMIRNWAGQSTSETFFDLCDEYGILVWNDFWLNTEGWNYNPADSALMLANVVDVLKRYRNHPSIALWCPRNEGVPPEPLNSGIALAIHQLDGTRYYQPNSRLVNLRSSGPWSNQPLEKYFQALNQGFSTELGASSIPSAEVMRTMMAPEDLWPPDDVWAYHDFHSKGAGDRGSVLGMITRRYGEAQNLEDLCRKAQLVNYETYRAIYEGFNSRLWTPCSGVLVWMSHPSWPSVVWQFYTWDYDPNAALFGAQKACEPVHIQMNLPDCRVAVINHGPTALSGLSATATLYNLQGKKVGGAQTKISAPANGALNAFSLAWPEQDAHLAVLELRDKKGKLLSENFYWHAKKESDLQQLNTLPAVTLKNSQSVSHTKNATVVTGYLINTSKTPALMARLTLRDAQTGQRVLPAYYRENFFSLLPGESREYKIECGPTTGKLLVEVSGWNLAAAPVPSGKKLPQKY